ncbi:MAG: selenium-dependent molybdenum cofactor biosynthesis protein YqeB [Eubacteriales bacterium]
MLEILRRLKGEKPIISIVGAGGKTTVMYDMAKLYAKEGFKVLVTTTTHIWEPPYRYQAKNLREVHDVWHDKRYAVVGTPLESGKWGSLAKNELEKYIQCADIVLIEADGAKGKPCKIPNDTEPVILPGCNVVINVVGMDALRKPLEEVCFRYSERAEKIEQELAEQQIENSVGILTETVLLSMISSDEMGRKNVGNRLYYVVLNKCDTVELQESGRRIYNKLQNDGAVEELFCKSRHQLGWIVVRGAGDLATGIIHRLHREGYKVLGLETEKPAAIRRKVAFSEAVYDKGAEVEGVQAELIEAPYCFGTAFDNQLEDVAESIVQSGKVPIIVDPHGKSIPLLSPIVVIDAIIAKRNLGTTIDMAPLTIALGPGFEAGKDVHFVIETMRGETLGHIISQGYAIVNTGIPGKINGVDKERVIHAPQSGVFCNVKAIGDVIEQGEVIACIKEYVEESLEPLVAGKGSSYEVRATIPGVLRGLLRDGYYVKKGFKVADIDPRIEERDNCNRITDKARKIADSVVCVLKDYA